MAVTNVCPACGQPISASDINIQQGVALCRSCGKLSRLADVVDQPTASPKELAAPPPGCSYEDQIGGGVIVRASCRSVGSALGVLAFCLFWNGIVSIFVVIALGALYTHFIGPLPKWFPVPSEHGHPQNIAIGETFFLCIFLIPFVTIGAGMFFFFLFSLMGRVDMILMGNDGRIRTGFGPINWTRRFDASKVKRVVEGLTSYQTNGRNKKLIQIEADRNVKFGASLPDERRQWMLGVLHLILVAKNKDARKTLGMASMARG